MERPRRVLIAHGDTAGRARVQEAAEAAYLRICGYASDVGEAVRQAQRTRPDICLLDLDLPGGGLVAAAEIAVRAPRTSVVVLGAQATNGVAATRPIRHRGVAVVGAG